MNKLLELNNIFSNLKEYSKKHKLVTRNIENGLTLDDALLFKLKTTELGKTQINAASDINNKNIKNDKQPKHYTLFTKKEKNITLPFYKDICDQILELTNAVCNSNLDSELSFVNTDGSVTHSQIKKNNCKININEKTGLQLSTNMGYTIGDDNIPIGLTYNGPNRNNEIQNLKQFINEHKLKNLVFVCDRAYYCYDLFDFIDSNNLFYIIRIDNDTILVDKDQNKINKRKDKILINKAIEKSRIIECTKTITQNVTVKGKKRYTIKRNTILKIATNLTQKNKDGTYVYSDEQILEYYKKRWDVEIFFKFIKKCFRFEEQNGSSFDENEKSNMCILILSYICKMISHIAEKQMKISKTIKKTKKIKNKRKTKVIEIKEIICTQTINQTNLINGIFSTLLDTIVDGKLTEKIVDNFIKCYTVPVINETNRYFERVCKTPFKKWYIKQYAMRYQWDKIINAIEKDTVDKLNKNLKLIANNVIKVMKERENIK